VPAGNQPSAAYYAATPGYFRALRIPITRGREFTEHDNAAATPVGHHQAKAWPPSSIPTRIPLGQRIQMGQRLQPAEIVGVAGDVRDQELEAKGVRLFTSLRPRCRSIRCISAFARQAIPPP